MVQTASTASRSIRTRFLAAAACLAVLVVIGMHRSAPSGASVAWPSSAAKLAGSWQSQTTCDHGFTPQQLELLKQLLESSGVTGSAATMDTAPTRANAGSSTPTTDGQESEETEPDSDDLPEPGPEPTDAAHARAWKELVRQGRDAKKEMRAAVQLRGARGECERPRAIAGYLDVSSNGREEFTHFAHASWRRIIKDPSVKATLDMVVFGNPATLEWVADLCHVLKIDRDLAQQRKAIKDKHACIFVPYPADEKVTKRFDYPYGNSFHFMLDPRAKSLFPDFYGWVLRSDWDVFYTPSLGSLCPETFRTGVGAYTDFSPSHPGDPNTADHLKELSKLYGLRHRGEHNVGSTWFGRTPEILALARLTYNVMPLLLKFHFEQKDPAHGEGPAHVLDGVGWQRWYAGVTLLYAGELASNHLLDEFEKSDQMDAASHGSVPVSDVFSIHCWWVEEPFAKFQFFAHHYDFMSLDGLDTSIAKDYCMDIALRSYRGIEE